MRRVDGMEKYRNESYKNNGVIIFKKDGLPMATVICQGCKKEQVIPKTQLDLSIRLSFHKGVNYIRKCTKCANLIHVGKNSYRWNGGKRNVKGYTQINKKYISKEDKKYVNNNSNREYFDEHRLIMARHLGRPLLEREAVHHLNSNKSDNRIENLELIDPSSHWAVTKEMTKLNIKIKELEKENSILKQDLYELVPD